MVDEKYYNLSCFVVFIWGFFYLHILFTFSALISNIYWCGIVSHQQILMVRHVALAKIIGAANAAPAAPVPTPMHTYGKRAVNNNKADTEIRLIVLVTVPA